jgi:hypothetical protein
MVAVRAAAMGLKARAIALSAFALLCAGVSQFTVMFGLPQQHLFSDVTVLALLGMPSSWIG